MDSRQCYWRFASIDFDEAGLKLIVDGRSVAIEAKPLAVLGVLLRRAGEVVTKTELLEAVWPGVTVVEASLPTAMVKLRRALSDGDPESRIIETVPRVGYRLVVPVEAQGPPAPPERQPALAWPASFPAVVSGGTQHGAGMRAMRRRHWAAGGLALAVVLGVGSLVAARLPGSTAAVAAAKPPPFSQSDARIALRKLDVERVEQLVRAGWNPNTPFDDEGNGAINIALQNCEWDAGHDRKRMLLMVRTLLESGAKLYQRNVWGDTAYSIARAPRYCGPHHPVTKMLRALCDSGYKSPGDSCLATYQKPARPAHLRKL